MWTCTCESEGNKICVTYEVWYMRCDSKLQVQSRWGLLNFEKLRSHKTRLPLAPLGLLFIWNVSPKWTQKMSVLTVTVNITWPKCGSNGLDLDSLSLTQHKDCCSEDTVATRLVELHSHSPWWSLLRGCRMREPFAATVNSEREAVPT